MKIKQVLQAYPEVFDYDGRDITDQEAIRKIAGSISKGSDTQKYLFDIGEKMLAVEKLFRLGLRSSAVALAKSLLNQSVFYHQYYYAVQICNYLVRHYYLFDNESMALHYDALYKKYREICDLEYQAQSVYLRMTYSREHLLPLKTEAILASVTQLESKLNIDSCTYHYYYYVCKCYLSEESDFEAVCLEAINYFENQYFNHSAYESVFKKYLVQHYRESGKIERAIATLSSFIKKVIYGDNIWFRYMHTYIDLLLELDQYKTALEKYKEVESTPQYQELPQDKKIEWHSIKEIILSELDRRGELIT